MIAPGSSRYSSNDMVHNHYLEEAKKKTQESGKNSRPSVMPSATSQSTTNGRKPKPKSNTQTSRNWPASKNRKIFDSSTTKVDSEPTNGSDEDITNQYEYEQTLDVSAGTLNFSAELGIHDHNNEPSSSKLVPKVAPPADKTTTLRQELELLFHHHITMLRLFKHVVCVFLKLEIDHYPSHDRVIHPLAPHYERKTRSDHGKKRPHESSASSSSTTLNHPSSSHPLDDTIDVNDEESFHSNSSSPSQNASSSSNVVLRVRQNPPHKIHNLNTYLSETINLQTQQRDAHREGLRSIRQALKDMVSGKQK
ncbi:hypothetical protein Tco_0292065 [Tanacetum coccineum]